LKLNLGLGGRFGNGKVENEFYEEGWEMRKKGKGLEMEF
jgi:hypothetical protein